jgi:hypothetical protein
LNHVAAKALKLIFLILDKIADNQQSWRENIQRMKTYPKVDLRYRTTGIRNLVIPRKDGNEVGRLYKASFITGRIR